MRLIFVKAQQAWAAVMGENVVKIYDEPEFFRTKEAAKRAIERAGLWVNRDNTIGVQG